MSIIKDGKEYEYNIDGDLVPRGSVTLDNMYGDFENRYVPKRETDSDWEQTVDRLFKVIDPLTEATDEECEEAVDEFFKQVDEQKKGEITCSKQ